MMLQISILIILVYASSIKGIDQCYGESVTGLYLATNEKKDDVCFAWFNFINGSHLNETEDKMIAQFIKEKIGDPNNKEVERARQWLRWQNDDDIVYLVSSYQKACIGVVPGLTAKTFWNDENWAWVKEFESNYEIIKKELMVMVNENRFIPNRIGDQDEKYNTANDGLGKNFHDVGKWNIFYIMYPGGLFDENQQKVPETTKILQKVLPDQQGHALFSAMSPNSYIRPHNGQDTKRLRVMFPIIGADGGAKMRVGEDWVYFQNGKISIFDDSFEHEVWHDGPNTRILLIADIWHPDLSKDEQWFFTTIENAEQKFILEQLRKKEDTKLSSSTQVLEAVKNLPPDEGWWVQNNQSSQFCDENLKETPQCKKEL
ncbi:aspartyl asparaginyl beta-hydroxylase [Stylonychia lemnae]|uniref:Aspartyl asparaginyl beta-hydroxylase n=1 Tax=Stylonychia lemnae TaxID=5949 RepID=A0A077ZWG2_STYLE|nr:aspartyl asparaginyl beta-hydroxylase [Stylonychia lemnae]|eukprot:CDW74204.1 aspartyl asparaginyl beta-hydroxylase [Stylonychia lemnae]